MRSPQEFWRGQTICCATFELIASGSSVSRERATEPHQSLEGWRTVEGEHGFCWCHAPTMRPPASLDSENRVLPRGTSDELRGRVNRPLFRLK